MSQTADPNTNIIVFNDQPEEQRNQTELQMHKKDSLKRIAQRTELIPIRSSNKSLVTKNILNNEEKEIAEEIVFDGGLKLTLNPEKSKDRFSDGVALPDGSDIMYEPGKRKKQRTFLPPLGKNKETGNREEIKVQRVGVKPFHEADSSAEIVLKSDRENSPAKLRSSTVIYRISSQLPDKKTFMMSPVPSGLTLQCTIRRDKSTFSKRFYTQYTLQISQNYQFLAIAKRLPYHCNSTYSISLLQDHYNDDNCIAQVRSNFWGSLFDIVDMTNKSQQRLVANARYENNCCQPSGPRRMSADVINATNKAASDTMSGSGVSALAAETNVTELVNKKPRYDEARKAYVMKFNHRVKRSSVKNFILVKKDESDKDILLFGKCNKQMFNLDISHPLSPMQAFAIALTSFDSKLVSE